MTRSKTRKPLAARQRNQRAFLRLRKRLAKTHGGQWIGLVDGKFVAAAATLEELRAVLSGVEPNVDRTMVFHADEPWPLWNRQARILPVKW